MSEITKDMQKNLDAFNKKHQKVLQKTAKELLAQGIAKVHYGVDYVNDDGDAADYAVLEYTDGRIEEIDEWLTALDYNTFGFGMTYCLPYTFDARTAKVIFDLEGGSMDAEESVIRMYHTTERREKLEAELEEFGMNLERFSDHHFEELEPIAQALQARGIQSLYFGVDYVDGVYSLSPWGILVFEDETKEHFEHFPNELGPILDLIDEFPQFGAFMFEVEDCGIEEDYEGGIVELNDTEYRAYHSQAQLEALEARMPS
jgi:hypothetical protein